MVQLLTLLGGVGTSAAILFLMRKKTNALSTLLKVLTVAYCTVCYLRFFLPDSFLYQINGAWVNDVYYEGTDVLGLVLRWGYYTNCVVLPMAVFTESRLFKNIALYVSFPFSVASVIFADNYMQYYLAPEGHGYHLPPTARYAVFIVEMLLALTVPILLGASKKHALRIEGKEEWKGFLLGLPLVLLAMMPTYVPQAILGYDLVQPSRGGTFHLIWIAVLFVLTLLIYYNFRFRSYADRKNLCLFCTLLLFFHYQSLYMMGLNISRLPFQLCNIASYFYLIVFLFKLKKMFHFCFITNTVGTLFAILLPDFSIGYYSFWTVHFIIQHSLVLMVAAFGMGLRIFPRIKRRSLLYFFIGYTIYVVFMYVLGTILNGYSDVTGETVNYFYMFNFDTAFEYFPFLSFIENYSIELGRFVLYPFAFVIVYIGFGLLCILFALLIKFCYRLEDDHVALRRSGIELYEKITGRKSRRPKHYID